MLFIFLTLIFTIKATGQEYQEYQEYRPPPTTDSSTTEDPLISTEINPRTGGGSGTGSVDSAHLNSVKRVISHVSIQNGNVAVPGVRHQSFEHLSVEGGVNGGYAMKDILVPHDQHGQPAIDLHKLNINVPSLRKRTAYKPGQRKYLQQHTSTMLEIDHGFVYAFGDDVVVADASRVYVMGGCGENMAGWALASDGEHQEWDSPDLKKNGFHRFSTLAVMVQRLGRSFFHWLTGSLPRLIQYLEYHQSEPTALARLRFLVYDEPFVVDALQLLGVDVGRQIIFFDPNAVYSAETLYAVSAAPCGQPPRPVLLHARRRVYDTLYPMPGADATPAMVERNRRRLQYANRRGLVLLVVDDRWTNVEEATEAIRRVYIQNNKGSRVELIVVNGGMDRRRGVDSGGGSGRSGGSIGGGGGGGGSGSSGGNGNGNGNGKPRASLGGAKGVKGTMLAEYSLWRRAELIVCASSESLANMMWSQNGTRVVELMPILPSSKGRRASLNYADMAGSLDLTYAMVPLETKNIHANLTVPINFLESALKLVQGV
jgi:uncharacterized membrane protein YgcG